MDIENPILFDKRLEVNEYKEPQVIGRCNGCKTELYNTDDYLKTITGYYICDDLSCLKQHLKNFSYIE